MNLACFIIWIIMGVFAIAHLVKNEPVNPISYFCAVIVCIVLYAEKLLIG